MIAIQCFSSTEDDSWFQFQSSSGLGITAEGHRNFDTGDIGIGSLGLHPRCRRMQELALRCARPPVLSSQEPVLPAASASNRGQERDASRSVTSSSSHRVHCAGGRYTYHLYRQGHPILSIYNDRDT